MAIETSLRPVARRIAQAIEDYAAAQGWQRGDYALSGSWNERTGRISLILGTARRVDERKWYSGLIQAIRQAFADQPWLTRNIGLVVENVQNLDEVYLESPGDDHEIDLSELLERS
jgi:hypothetical protein